jgi:hypothetical protein
MGVKSLSPLCSSETSNAQGVLSIEMNNICAAEYPSIAGVAMACTEESWGLARGGCVRSLTC